VASVRGPVWRGEDGKVGTLVCTKCGGSTIRFRRGGYRQVSIQGMCTTCYDRQERQASRAKNKELYGNIYGPVGAVLRVSTATYGHKWHYKLKLEVIDAYGGKCECCGETEPVFLTIDHIDNSGAVERGSRLIGTGLYKRLKDWGWPKDRYRLLCFNCNIARGQWGSCPHGGC